MIRAYIEDASSPMFLSGFFQSPPENFHTSERVEIDIERDDRDVAVVITALEAGRRQNENTVYTNKDFKPPIYDEEGTITSYDLIKRVPGQDPFMAPDFQANATLRSFRLFRKLERKVRRAIELQAAQVLQTAALDLQDQNGATLYSLDYDGKTAHFPQVTTSWATSATATPIDDLESLADVILTDGKSEVENVIMGRTAFLNFQKSTQVQTIADNRRFDLVRVDAPETRGQGAKFHGVLSAGQYRMNIWSYTGRYRNPNGGATVPYVDPNKVIMMAPGRLDLTFGAIPLLRGPEQRALPFLPPRISDGGAGIDLTTNAWFTPDGRHLNVSAGTRPLCIPTAIDTFGCLNTVQA
jgi:hypothetical protein